LYEIGVEVIRKTSVDDAAMAIEAAIIRALDDADVIIVSGGLGPTSDDITKPSLAAVFGKTLVMSEKAMESVKRRLAEFGKKVSGANLSQAMIPEGSDVLINRFGTAPGICIRKNDKILFALPGVPNEMKSLLDEQILPILKAEGKRKFVVTRDIFTTGEPESNIGENVSEIVFNKCVKIGFYPNFLGIAIHVAVEAESEEDAREILDNAVEKICDTLGEAVYSTNGDQLEEVVGNLLRRAGLTVSLAESCTGGLLGNRLTDVSGSSDYFVGGVVAYSNSIKNRILGVSQEILDNFGAVSEPCAKAMAKGVRELYQTDISISITGIAGPTGGTPEKPVGTVFIALSAEDHVECNRFNFGKNNPRLKIKARSAQAALNMIRLYLSGRVHQ
jgi:nicotinamide-nucleotide amidase